MTPIIIIGAPRCGTTACFRWLIEHPEIVPSSRKELNYFTGFSGFHDGYVDADLGAYADHFVPQTGAQVTLEASPFYSHPQLWPYIYHRMAASLPNARLVLLMRDPVARFISHYLVEQREGKEAAEGGVAEYITRGAAYMPSAIGAGPFDEDIWLEIGDYARILEAALTAYPASQIQPIFTEWFSDDPVRLATILSSFMGLEDPLNPEELRQENAYYATRSLGLHRVASGLRQSAEPLLQRLPALRRSLYGLYKGINVASAPAAGGDDPLSASERAQLMGYYSPRNTKLRTLLADNFALSDVPAWLSTK